MNFKKATLNRLMLIILILSGFIAAFSASADGYADIGYNDGLLIESAIRVKSIVYIKAVKGVDFESYGAGLGFTKKNYTAVLSVNIVADDYSVDLYAGYYDIGKMSYFVNISRTALGRTGYKLGLGYGLNEKVSLVTSYSNGGVFFGIRRWL